MKFYKIKKSSNPKKETALKWLSKYVRRRDAIKTTGDVFYAKCITCGKTYPVEDMDAGHAISGRMNSILFNEDLVHAQCRPCNREGGGQTLMYEKVMIDMYGPEKWDYWQSTKNDPVKYTDFDYEQIAKMFRQKYKQLGNKL
jgi:hypothetical protein